MREHGIALLIGLILLAALSLLALVSTSGMMLQRRMAANFEQRSAALEKATMAQSWARAWLYSRADHERESDCETACILPAGILNSGELPRLPEFESESWWRGNTFAAGLNPETGQLLVDVYPGEDPPRWVVEEVHYQATGDAAGKSTAEGLGWYRILSRASGTHPGSIAVTEVIVARPWGGDFLPVDFPAVKPSAEFCRQFEDRYDCGIQAWRQRR